MKKLFFSLMMASALMACNQPEKKKIAYTTDGADLRFEKEAFDFGKIKEGDKVTHSFKFTNMGKSPLIVRTVTVSCGCTTPVWPHTPIMPGDTASVSATFDSHAKTGLQDKLITVTSNSQPAQTIVHLVGEVLAKQ